MTISDHPAQTWHLPRVVVTSPHPRKIGQELTAPDSNTQPFAIFSVDVRREGSSLDH